MDFSFDLEIELNEKSLMYIVYPQIFEENYVLLETTIEVEDYQKERSAPDIRCTKDYRFYDSGDNFEVSYKITAVIMGKSQEIPSSLIRKEINIVEKIREYVVTNYT